MPPPAAEMNVPIWRMPAAPDVPMWKAMGVPKDRHADLSQIEQAAADGDFEKAIALRDALRLSSGARRSVHQMSAEL